MTTSPAQAALNFANYTTTAGLGDNNVSGVFVEGSTVYAATRGGLSISTDGGANFTNRTTAAGLGDNGVSGVFAAGTTIYAATSGGLSISAAHGAAQADVSAPAPVLQQFGRPNSLTCDEAQPQGLNWGGASSGGWSESYAMWMNNGTGGAVCTRTLVYNNTLRYWVAN